MRIIVKPIYKYFIIFFRCVGRMVGPNTLHAVSIRAATSDELANLPRLCYICDHAVAKNV